MSTAEEAGAARAGASDLAQEHEEQPSEGGSSTPLRLVLGGLAVVGVVAAAHFLPLADWISSTRSWIESLGAFGPIAYGLLYVAAALLLMPGSVITLFAGAFFGMWAGTVLVSIAATVAAALAFLLARSTLRGRVEAWASERPKFAAVESAIASEGWKVVGLMRLSPVVPYSIANYLFGLTPVRFVPYVLVSWVTMLPGTFLWVYIGHAGKAAATGAAGVGRYVLLAVGLIATVAVTVLLSRSAKRRLEEQTSIST